MTTNEFEKGQKVHILASSNGRRFASSPWRTGTVTRVGRKYVFVVDDVSRQEKPFLMDDGCEKTEYSGQMRRVFTDAGRVEYDRAQAVRTRLFEYRLHDLVHKGLSVSALEKIVAIIDADKAQKA